jgi:hypothetical protein
VIACAAAAFFLGFPWPRAIFLAIAGASAGSILSSALNAARIRRTTAGLLAEGRTEAARRFAERAQLTRLLDLGLGAVFDRAGAGPYHPPIGHLPAVRLVPYLLAAAAAYATARDLPVPAGIALCLAASSGTLVLESLKLRGSVRAALADLEAADREAAAGVARRFTSRHGPLTEE